MEDLNFNLNYYGIYINFFLLVFLSFKSYTEQIISKEVFYLFLLSCLGPILFHNFLLIDSVFPDQGGYFDNIEEFRHSYDFSKLRHAYQSQYLAKLLSIIPIPYLGTIYAATFLNKFMLLILIIYLIKYNYIKDNQFIILLLYPSLFLYSSLMLKETAIIFLITFSYIYLTQRKFLFCLLGLFLVSLIKPHLAILFGIVFIFYVMFLILKLNTSYLIFGLLASLVLLILDQSILAHLRDKLNMYIYNFYLEDNNYSSEIIFDRNLLNFNFDSMFFIISNLISFWFIPFIFNTENIMQLAQSIENIFVLTVLIYYIYKLYLKNITKAYYIILSLLFVTAPYAIVVENVGTLARYRFSIVFIFVIIIFNELNSLKRKNVE